MANWAGSWMAWHQRSSWVQPRAWILGLHRHAVFRVNSSGRLEFQRMGCQNTLFRDQTRTFVQILALPLRGVAHFLLLYAFSRAGIS